MNYYYYTKQINQIHYEMKAILKVVSVKMINCVVVEDQNGQRLQLCVL